MSFFTSPRPRFRYYAVPQQSFAIARDVLLGRAKKGDDVSALETDMRELLGVSHAVATPQARIGIYLAISALVQGKKKKVILSPYTIHDVINMVICAGGEPVFADIEHGTCNISADKVEELIDDETSAVLVTHLHGLACDVPRIADLCRQHDAALIEDCAQALGARVDHQLVGTFGDVGIYSFGRAKNINALFGGMMVTNRAELAASVREKMESWPYFSTLRLIKQAVLCFTTNLLFSPPLFPVVLSRMLRYSHMAPLDPFNKIVRGERNPTRRPSIPDDMFTRLTPMQARLAKEQLPEADRFSAIRTEYAKVYHDGLADIPEVTIPPLREDGSHIYLTYPIQVPNREQLLTFMLKRGRDITRQYLANNANAECYAEFQRPCPCAASTAVSTLLLPTYPDYGMREAERNVAAIREFYLGQRDGISSAADPLVGERERTVESETESALAKEAAVLLQYVLGQEPDEKMVEHYVHAIKMSEPDPVPLRLPWITKKYPRLLRLFEPVTLRRSAKQEHPLKKRLAEASRIANIGFAPLFYDYQGKSLLSGVAQLAGVGLVEASILPLRLVGGMLWRR